MDIKFGYARVSSAGQRLDVQFDRLADCDRVFHEKASGAELMQALGDLFGNQTVQAGLNPLKGRTDGQNMPLNRQLLSKELLLNTKPSGHPCPLNIDRPDCPQIWPQHLARRRLWSTFGIMAM